MTQNKKVILCLIFLSAIVFVLGIHGGSEYYFHDFCVHKALNMFYNNGSPEFFRKPNFVPDLYAIGYSIYYFILHQFNLVSNFDEFVRYLNSTAIPTPIGNLSFILPALIINNLFAVIGVCFTFLTTYILTDKKILPSFIGGLTLAGAYSWMNFSHHLSVDIPLTSLCITAIFYTIYFIKNKNTYSTKDIIVLGILCGLCTSAKYNGAVIILAPLYVLYITEQSKRTLFFKILLFLQFSLFAFFITNPYIFINFGNFYTDFMAEYNQAFINGYAGFESKYSCLFHLFHSFPNAIGVIPYLCAIAGLILFCLKFKQHNKIKYPLILFSLAFFILMSRSDLVFFRYILPLVPVLAVFAGIFSDYLLQNIKYKKLIYFLFVLYIFMNFNNIYHFYQMTKYEDIRTGTKKVFQELKLNKNSRIFYNYDFNEPDFHPDFLNQFPNLQYNIQTYLYSASNLAGRLLGKRDNDPFSTYSIIIFDSYAKDLNIYIRKEPEFAHIKNQYFMYFPKHLLFKGFLPPPEKTFYVVQISPYKTDKSNIPFDLLRTDWMYRTRRGPFIEIYFENEKLRDKFSDTCSLYSIKCTKLNLKDGYYYNQLIFKNSEYNL